jgi:SAM-dependent methyltransferase
VGAAARSPRAPLLTLQLALNRLGKTLAVRLRGGVHPKHLIDDGRHTWYTGALRPTDLVLDVGCGTGVHSLRVAPLVAGVVAIDRDGPVLDRMRPQPAVAVLRWDVDLPWRALEAVWPLPARAFDVILLLDVLEHLRHRLDVLGQIRRVLKDDGRLFVTGPNRLTTWRRRLWAAGLDGRHDPDHHVEYTPAEFLAELAQAGFAVPGGLAPIVYDSPWAGVLDALGALNLRLYREMAWRKWQRALREPGETTGWQAVAVKAEGWE